jgi:hypothetical protein
MRSSINETVVKQSHAGSKRGLRYLNAHFKIDVLSAAIIGLAILPGARRVIAGDRRLTSCHVGVATVPTPASGDLTRHFNEPRRALRRPVARSMFNVSPVVARRLKSAMASRRSSSDLPRPGVVAGLHLLRVMPPPAAAEDPHLGWGSLERTEERRTEIPPRLSWRKMKVVNGAIQRLPGARMPRRQTSGPPVEDADTHERWLDTRQR